jgi:hypothetical protein
MTFRRILPLAFMLLVAGTVSLGAQSLAKIAEKEEARRKETKKATRVYTNKDVKPAPTVTPPVGATTPDTAGESSATPGQNDPAAAAGSEAKAGESADQSEQPAQDAEKTPSEGQQPANGEEQWRARITEAREALERSQIFAQALQSRINSLWMDFTSRDDPAQRAVIDAERKKSIAQLDRVKAEIVTQTKAIADIEEEARRAGVPPGWLR